MRCAMPSIRESPTDEPARHRPIRAAAPRGGGAWRGPRALAASQKTRRPPWAPAGGAGAGNSVAQEWRGGEGQGAMIAMALASAPRLLLADEPTTALDVTLRGQILELLSNLQRQTGMAVL